MIACVLTGKNAHIWCNIYSMGKKREKELQIGLVVMASGLGKRFGGNKLMEIVEGKPLIKWILDSTENLFYKRIVVTRSAEVKALCDGLNIECIIHEYPNRNDTVRLGLSALIDDVDYCFFTPGDQPLIKRESIIRLIDEAKNQQDKIVRASFNNTVGSPVGFPKIYFSELLNLPEGKGGNFIVKENPTNVHNVEVNDEYELLDVDTVSDLEAIKKLERLRHGIQN